MMKGRRMSSNTDLNTIDIRREAFADFMADYPYASEVDSIDDLPVQMFTADDNGTPFQARVLGFGSSYRKTHLNHLPGTKPGKGVRCSGCRWTDTAILWAQPLDHKAVQALEVGRNNDPYGSEHPADWEVPAAGQRWQYVFVSLGKSAIEGEWQRDTVIWTEDAEDVLRKLFVPTKKDFRRDTGAMAIPPHNASAFRDAACVDETLADLLERYAAVIPEVDRTGPDADPLAGL
jgi:hypothetical protein